MTTSSERNIQFLAVEDDSADRDLISKYIKDSGLKVDFDFSESGVDGLCKLGENQPDCILIDYRLPDMTGLEFIQNIPNSHKELVVVVLTGFSDLQSAVECMKEGAHDYLSKEELSPQTLRRAIENAMEKVRLRNELEKNRLSALQNSKLAALGNLAGNIAHEINNPLAILDANLKNIKKCSEAIPSTEQILEKLSRSQRACDRISKVVKGVQLYWAELSNEETELVTVGSILDRFVDDYTERFAESPVELKIGRQAVNERVECNLVQICQVFLRIASRSIETIENLAKPYVSVEATFDSHSVVFSIATNGSGIFDQIKDQSFEDLTDEFTNSVGLELGVSKGILEKFSGSLILDSRKKKIIVELPRYCGNRLSAA